MIKKLEELAKRYDVVNEMVQDPELVKDPKKYKEVMREHSYLTDVMTAYKEYRDVLQGIEDSQHLITEESDHDMKEMAREELKTLEGQLPELEAKIKMLLIPPDPLEEKNIIMEIRGGTGGDEASLFAADLFRMYTRYAERNGYKVTVIDSLAGDDAGLKSITFTVEGENAYGYLKSEKGVHRLVRISPFDSQSRRQTSFASVEVMPKIDDAAEIVIRPEDLKIDTYRSGGAGGQHVNKTDSAVRINIPTGIVVQCQNERSQIQNREQAMEMLRGKLAERQEQEQQEHEAELKGEVKKIEWGSQIRSYVFCPYTMVKDHRTGCETGNITAVMDGELEDFIFDFLKKSKA